jgi:hypothetical protein
MGIREKWIQGSVRPAKIALAQADRCSFVLVSALLKMASNHATRVYDSIMGLLSGEENPTPLVRLHRVVPFRHAHVYAKLEWYNPFGAVKDRVGPISSATPRRAAR